MNKPEIEKDIETLRSIYPSQKEIRTGEYDHVADALDDAISALEHQLTNGWIQVSERVPSMEECQKNDCRFIVTDTNRTYQSIFDYIRGYFATSRFDCSGMTEDACVMYWQPMPDKSMCKVMDYRLEDKE